MRGKGTKVFLLSGYEGITPAYAGKSELGFFGVLKVKDHPRICGEKGTSVMSTICVLGSPPHMRGKGSQAVEGPAQTGITPAYAGKRNLHHNSDCVLEDHPRICGEKIRVL